jgi:succinoglycan biosynthesis transport protein ExoP
MHSSNNAELVRAVHDPARASTTANLSQEITIRDLLALFKRRSWIVMGTLALFVCAGLTLCVLSTPRYAAVGELQVQKEGSDRLGLESMTGEGAVGSDSLDENITIQTQAQLLQSSSLALKVIRDLDLERNDDFRPKFSLLGWLWGPFARSGPEEGNDDSGLRTRVLKVFSKNLKVKPVSGTRLIDVTYLNPDRKVTAAVVNSLITELINFNFQTRYDATSQAANWLGGQLADLRKSSEELQAKVVRLQLDSGVFTLGETDMQGREQVYTPVLDRLQQATTQVAQAESNRIMKGALYQVVKDGDPELISGLMGSAILGSAATNSLTLIQNLRAQEAVAQAQLNQSSAKFGSAYPKIDELRANLEGIRGSIRAESERVAKRAKNDFEMSQIVEDDARKIFADEKKQADALNNKAIEYTLVRQEAEKSRALYQGLLSKLKEAGLLAGLRSSNITIVDPARIPSKPAKPNVPVYLALSLVGGLVLGSCGAFLRDTMDDKIQDVPQLEAYLGEMPIGVLPFYKEIRTRAKASRSLLLAGESSHATDRLPAINQPQSPYTEALRAMRTSLMLARGGAPPQVILVTSSIQGEGKSTLSVNLAVLLAQQNQGKKVLLVDTDLRHPMLHHRLNLSGVPGLSDVLASDHIESNAKSSAISLESAPGLDVLASGPVPPYPAELLGSEQMRRAVNLWRQEYAFIIMDAAPLLPVTDAALLSNLSDLTLVVARDKVTTRQSLERSCRLLQNQGQQKIGIVFNAVQSSTHKFYGYGYEYSS